MSIDYDFWLSLEYWSFEEAACLFAGRPPSSTKNSEIFSNHKKHLSSPSENIKDLAEFYHWFQSSDWSHIDENATKNQKASPLSFLVFSTVKDIKISPDLIHKIPDQCKKEIGIKTRQVIEKSSPDAEIIQPLKKAQSEASKTTNTKSTNNSDFAVFHNMESLSYEEITISFLAGDMIELSARGTKKSYSYEFLRLRDMRRKGDFQLNSQGRFLARLLSNDPPKPDKTGSKHKDALKKLINSWFCISGDPFRKIGSPPTSKYEPKFGLVDESNRASRREQNRAAHESFDTNNLDHCIQNEAFDEEDDEAGRFLKENQ